MITPHYKQSKALYKSTFQVAFVVLLFLHLSLLSFSLQGHPKNNQQELHDTIRVGCEDNYPPYCFINKQGEPDGFSVELFRAAAEEMGLHLHFKTDLWNNLKFDLAKNKIDALPLVGRTPEREKLFDFTVPYLQMHGAIVVRDDQDTIHTLKDLSGKEVAVMKGDNAEEFLRRSNLNTEIIQRSTFKQALSELSNGQHDAVLIQRFLALKIMRDNGFSNLKLVGDPTDLFKQSFCFAVTEDNEELLSILNEGLSIVNKNGTYRKLHAKWFAPIDLQKSLSKRIIVGIGENYPPFEYKDKNGNPAGYNVELLKAIARETDMNIEFHLDLWSNIRKGLESGNIDAINVLYSHKRDKYFDMTPAHTNISYNIATRKGKKLPENLQKLKGKKILVQKGDIMHDHALNLGFSKELILVDSQEEALSQLHSGKHDYALTSRILFNYHMDKNKWGNLKISKETIYSADYCIGVKEGNVGLRSRFTEGLATIKASGKYHEVYSEWLGIYEKPDYTFNDLLKHALYVLVPLLLILIASLIWSRTLKNQVKKRTRELKQENEERKKAEEALQESLHRIELITSNIPNIIWKTDIGPNGEFVNTYISDTVDEFLALPKNTIKSNWDTYFSYVDSAYLPHLFDQFKKAIDHPGETLSAQYPVIKNNGERVWFLSAGRAYFEHNTISIFGYTSDITERLRTEEKLRDLNQKLQAQNEQIAAQNKEYETLNEELNEKNKHLQEINAKLEEARKKAEESDKLKSAFLANMSHEIRTPMNGIMGFAELLRKPQLNGGKKTQYINMIRKSGERMLEIINNLLDIAKIEAGQIDVDASLTCINEILEELEVFFKPSAEEKQLSLSYTKTLSDECSTIITDGTKINQILINLIKNALKYTKEGSIEFGYTLEDSMLLFYVTDTGIGISPELQEKMFERFRQAELSSSREYEGAGLGLSISKAYVNMLGGKIWLNSQPGRGTTFYFSIPYNPSASQTNTSDNEKENDPNTLLQNLRILITEDDETSYLLIKESIGKYTQQLHRAKNGKEAVNFIESHPDIDLVLMDLKMPLMDGYKATQQIKQIRPNLPVIAQTAFASNKDRKKAFNSGCDEYISKPIDFKKLQQIVQKLL